MMEVVQQSKYTAVEYDTLLGTRLLYTILESTVTDISRPYYRVSHDTGHQENLAKSQAHYKHEQDI